jgi:RNA polymerase sigma-70 factor (ECF subfamily)
VFEKLLERDCRVLRNLRDPGLMRAYLCRVARTVTVDHLRSDPTVLQLTGAHELGGPFADPREIAAAQEKYKVLEEVLQKLSDRHRLFLSLYYEQGLAYREIAELTATPIRTVGSVLHRARKAARSLLEKRGARPPGRRGGA